MAAGGVGAGLQEPVAGRRAVHGEGRGGGDAPVQGSALDVPPRPGRALAADLDDGHAVGGHADADLLGGERGAAGVAAEHQLVVGVLVVGHEHRVVAVVRADQADVVVVVAELPLLGRGALPVEVEGGRVGEDRVAPRDDRRPGEAVGDDDLVETLGLGRDRREAEGGGGLRPGGGGRWGRGRCGCLLGPGHRGQPDDGSHQSAALEDAAARGASRDEVTEVGVVGGVGHRLAAGVVAAEVTGHRGAAARVGAEQGQHGAPGRGCSHVVVLRGLEGGGVPPAPTLGTTAQGRAALR